MKRIRSSALKLEQLELKKKNKRRIFTFFQLDQTQVLQEWIDQKC
jgi:hypothetical protein